MLPARQAMICTVYKKKMSQECVQYCNGAHLFSGSVHIIRQDSASAAILLGYMSKKIICLYQKIWR